MSNVIQEVTDLLPRVVNSGRESEVWEMFGQAGTILESSNDAYKEYVMTRYRHYMARFQHHETSLMCAARQTWAGYLYE